MLVEFKHGLITEECDACVQHRPHIRHLTESTLKKKLNKKHWLWYEFTGDAKNAKLFPRLRKSVFCKASEWKTRLLLDAIFLLLFFLNTAIKNSDEVMCLSVRCKNRNATTGKRSRLLSSGWEPSIHLQHSATKNSCNLMICPTWTSQNPTQWQE